MTLKEQMSQDLVPALRGSIEIETWWNSLSDWEHCIAVAEVGEELGFTAAQFVRAMEKPWHWKVEAWRFRHGMEVE